MGSADFNKVLLIGRLTKDPELRYLPNGTPKAELRLATSRQYKDKNGERQEDTCYVDIVVWSRQAEIASQYLQKGRQVFVEGRLDYQEWTSQDGQKRNKHAVVADRVLFLDGGRGGGGAPGGFGGEGENAGTEEGGARPRAYGQGNSYGGGGYANRGNQSYGRPVAGGAQTYGARPNANTNASHGGPDAPSAPVAAPQAAIAPSIATQPRPNSPDEAAPPAGGMAEAMGIAEEELPF